MESTAGILTGAFDGMTAAPEDAIAVEDERIVPDAFVVERTADRNSPDVGGFLFHFRCVLPQTSSKREGSTQPPGWQKQVLTRKRGRMSPYDQSDEISHELTANAGVSGVELQILFAAEDE